MRVAVPISNPAETEYFDSGQDVEFFCGYMPEWWLKKVYETMPSAAAALPYAANNRSIQGSITDVEAMRILVEKCNEKNIELLVAMNVKTIPPQLYVRFDELVEHSLELGINYFIVTSYEYSKHLSERYPAVRIALSCLAQTTNSYAARRFSETSSVRRIMLPRHLSAYEICNIATSNPNCEFEFFIFSNRCPYDDGRCNASHAFSAICREALHYIAGINDDNSSESLRHSLQTARFNLLNWTLPGFEQAEHSVRLNQLACSACSVPIFLDCPNITTAKLSIRGRGFEERIAQYEIASRVISIARSSSPEAVRNWMKNNFGENFCSGGLHCMIPDQWGVC